MRSILPAVKELERIFDLAATRFPEDLEVPKRPVIVIQTRGRKKSTLGWHWAETWQNGEPEPITEITICAEALNRPPLEVAETLVHEMVHLYNHANGVRDVSGHQYHNAKFRKLAERVGLVVAEPTDSRGHAYTSLGDELRAFLESIEIDASAFSLARRERKRRKAPTKMKKWECLGCDRPMIVRCARDLNATCEDCGEPFILA